MKKYIYFLFITISNLISAAVIKESTTNKITYDIILKAYTAGDLDFFKLFIGKEDEYWFHFLIEDKEINKQINKKQLNILLYLIKISPHLFEWALTELSEPYVHKKNIIYILEELEYYPNIIIEPTSGFILMHKLYPKHVSDIVYKFIQMGINIEPESEHFNKNKELAKSIIKSNEITKIKTLENLNKFFSCMQMAELIIEQINSEKYSQAAIIELIKLAAINFDLSRLRDRNFKTILAHALTKASNRNISIFILCNYGNRNLLDNSIFEPEVVVELVEIMKIFNANKLKLLKKQDSSCSVM